MTGSVLLTNPDAFDTVDELRRELHQANDALFTQMVRLGQLNDGATQMAGLINNILIAHLKNDATEMSSLLNDYLAERERLREKLEERIESDHIRSTH